MLLLGVGPPRVFLRRIGILCGRVVDSEVVVDPLKQLYAIALLEDLEGKARRRWRSEVEDSSLVEVFVVVCGEW